MNPEVATALICGLALTAGFIGLGGRLLMLIGYVEQPADALRLTPVAAAIGFAATSYVAFGLVAFGPPHAVLIALWSAFGCILGHRFLGLSIRQVGAAAPDLFRKLARPVPAACMALGGGYLVLASMNWLTPVKEGDALLGYMFTARWYYTHGLTLSPYNTLYALFPSNTELVFALSYAFGTDLIGKVLDGFLGVLLLGAVYEFARRYASPVASFLAAVSLGMMTEFVISWGVGKVDVLSSFTFVAGVSLLLLKGARLSAGGIAMAAFLIGTACAQKYTVWVFAPSIIVPI